MKLLDNLTPYFVDSKIRLGPNEDGGYVCSKLSLDESSSLFTYGVGNDWRYEIDYNQKYNKSVFMFDHTIDLDTNHPMIHFKKEGLGFDGQCDDFIKRSVKPTDADRLGGM